MTLKKTRKFDFQAISRKANLSNAAGETNNGRSLVIPMADIEVSENVRNQFNDESLKELADSIEALGLQNPITVKAHPEKANKWIIVTGERRYRAMTMLGKDKIRVLVDDGKQTTAKQLIENIQREDMNILDVGLGIQKVMELEKTSVEETAKLIGKNKRFVYRALSVVKLPKQLQDFCSKNQLNDTFITDALVKILKQNPKYEAWWIKEISSLIDQSDETFPETETPRVLTRTNFKALQSKFEKMIHKLGAVEEKMPLSDVPLTLANASKLKNVKGYEKFDFNGIKIRQTCIFEATDEYRSVYPDCSRYVGNDEDPKKRAQLTTITVKKEFADEEETCVIEYKNQLWVVPLISVTLTGMLPLSNKD